VNPLKGLGAILSLDSLLFQEIEGFVDVVLMEEKVREAVEDFICSGSIHGSRIFSGKITISDHFEKKKSELRNINPERPKENFLFSNFSMDF
jgi:phosphosulfolactate phosphohydrolase-like enzyme